MSIERKPENSNTLTSFAVKRCLSTNTLNDSEIVLSTSHNRKLSEVISLSMTCEAGKELKHGANLRGAGFGPEWQAGEHASGYLSAKQRWIAAVGEYSDRSSLHLEAGLSITF